MCGDSVHYGTSIHHITPASPLMLFIPLPRKTTRKGTPRSRTGCSTCKIRRVKCDETHPVCIKCTSTGRKCPGYVPPVPKASGSLQNIRPAVIPGAGGAELRSLDLLRRLIAPGLTEPIPESFWTYDIPQAAHQEPTILHAAVAASSLYEACRDDSHVGVRQRQFAMQHYNKAIQQILTSQVEHLDSVVMACLAFIRIEFLLGNIKGAYTHYHHGKVLLKSYNPSQQLLTIFRRLDIFILLFSQLADLSSVDDAAIMTSDEKPGNSDKSEKVIDWLARRSMRMTLLFSELSSTSSPLLVPMASPASSVSSQAIPAVDPILKQTLDSWSLAVACLVVSNSLRPDKTELDCMLQARLLVCKLSLIMETHAGVPNRVNEAKPGRLVGIISDVMGFDSNLTVEAINLGAKITCRALICASNMDKSDLNMEDIEKGLGIGED